MSLSVRVQINHFPRVAAALKALGVGRGQAVPPGQCAKCSAVTLMSFADVVLRAHAAAMFCVDEATAASIRRAFMDDGDLSAVVEFRRHFPLITDHARALECARIIAGWVVERPETEAHENVVPIRKNVVPLKPRLRPKL